MSHPPYVTTLTLSRQVFSLEQYTTCKSVITASLQLHRLFFFSPPLPPFVFFNFFLGQRDLTFFRKNFVGTKGKISRSQIKEDYLYGRYFFVGIKFVSSIKQALFEHCYPLWMVTRLAYVGS